jgi:hypothetical protein
MGDAQGTPPLNCAEARGRLSQYADGALNAEETRRVEAHVAGCEGCARELRLLRSQERLLTDALSGLRPTDSFRGRVSLLCAQTLEKAERLANSLPERGWRLFRWLFGFVAVAYFVGLLFAFGPPWRRQPENEFEWMMSTLSPFFWVITACYALGFFLLLDAQWLATLECRLAGRLGSETPRRPSRLEVVALEVLGVLAILLCGFFLFLLLARLRSD